MKASGRKNKSASAAIPVLSVVLIAGIMLAVCVGKYPVTPLQSARILLCELFGKSSTESDMAVNVVLRLRLPRVLSGVVVGAALSLSGAVYQGIFKNPLVSPDFLGVSGGACVGAAIAILMSLSVAFIQLFSFAGGLIAVLLTVSIPALMRNRSNIMLVLSGIIVGAAMSSVLGFIKFAADPETQLAEITYWTMGSFSNISAARLLSVLPVMLAPAAVMLLISWWVDVLSVGENEARTLGANVRLVRGISIVCATLMTAGSVCVAGTIGWVGLVVPHFGRMLSGYNSRRSFPVSALVGAVFMLIVDTLTRLVGVSEMPVSILTGLIGAPFYIWLLRKQRQAIM